MAIFPPWERNSDAHKVYCVGWTWTDAKERRAIGRAILARMWAREWCRTSKDAGALDIIEAAQRRAYKGARKDNAA